MMVLAGLGNNYCIGGANIVLPDGMERSITPLLRQMQSHMNTSTALLDDLLTDILDGGPHALGQRVHETLKG